MMQQTINKKKVLKENNFFWRLLFATTHWPGYLYSLYLSKKYPIKNYKKYFKDKNVYCIGTGPSLDAVDFKSIKNSTVLLLNSAYKIHDSLDNSNEIIWMAQDVDVILDLKKDVPKNMKKIVTFHTFKKAIFCIGLFNKNDGFCLPSFFLHKAYGFIPITRVKKTMLNDKFILKEVNLPLSVMPFTVMLTAIRIAASFQSKRIILLGFDLSYFKNKDYNPYAKLTYSNVMNKSLLDLHFDEIELFLAKLYEELQEANIEIYNWSPLSKDKVLPRLEN